MDALLPAPRVAKWADASGFAEAGNDARKNCGKAPPTTYLKGTMHDLPAIMTVRTVADALSFKDEETVCRLIRNGHLRASLIGTDADGNPCPPYGVRREDLHAFLDMRVVQVQATPPSPPTPRQVRRRRPIVPLVIARGA
jgi:hypothetical protein